MLQDLLLGGLRRSAEYFTVLGVQRLQNSSLSFNVILLALGKIRRSLSDVWPSLSKFAPVERHKLVPTVVVM